MAGRSRPLNPLFALVVVVGLLMVGYLALRGRYRTRYLAETEYWVYLPGTELPPQQDLMNRLIGGNPYQRGPRGPINTPEGLVLSDVRLGIGLVLRKKNPDLFRPDLHLTIQPDASQLQALSESHSLVRLRFLSEVPLPDKRHLQFLIHAADAYAELGGGTLVLDFSAERLWSRAELQAVLKERLDATGFANHVSLLLDAKQCLVTKGFGKIGLPELVTPPIDEDQETLVRSLVGEFGSMCWGAQQLMKGVDLTHLDVRFTIQPEEPRDGKAQLRILRIDS